MDRLHIPKDWIGRRVMLIPLDERGHSLRETQGWLRGIEEEGVWFAKGFHSDSLKRMMPENPRFYPWHRVGHLEPSSE